VAVPQPTESMTASVESFSAPPAPPLPAPIETTRRLVVIGASTGGPQALTRLLRALPANFPVPIALVLHIPAGYTQPFAERLDAECAVHAVEASDGLRLLPGMVAVARGGMHLRIEAAGDELLCRLALEPSSTAHRPAVDALFESVVDLGSQVVAIVLTGMGDDGAASALQLHLRGATVLTESESSCIVYGMPRAVVECGASTASAPIEDMAALLLRHLATVHT
ncbi:MAG: CheB methylesterase domain-containing protein, partial [Polyangia bacterium]